MIILSRWREQSQFNIYTTNINQTEKIKYEKSFADKSVSILDMLHYPSQFWKISNLLSMRWYVYSHTSRWMPAVQDGRYSVFVENTIDGYLFSQ